MWYGNATRSSRLAKTILQGTLQGGRRRGRQRKQWEDIKEWTHLQWCPNGQPDYGIDKIRGMKDTVEELV